MSNETKRDVFEDTVDTLHVMDGAPDDYCKKLLDRYAGALPDDLPVIPQTVGDILRSAHGQTNLLGMLETAKNGYKLSKPLAWIIDNQNIFATAWVLGVWHVEETGEVVKL